MNAIKYRGETRNRIKIATWHVGSLKQDRKNHTWNGKSGSWYFWYIGYLLQRRPYTIKIGLPD